MRRWWLLVMIVAVLGVWLGLRPRTVQTAQGGLVGLPANPAGFAQAEPGRTFTFPRDHGPHPEFQTEWWYYTGNLKTEDGREFGYQLTFFRRGLAAPAEIPARASAWADGQVYMAHLALSDVGAGGFSAFERFSRGGAGLAGAQGEPGFAVWLEDWRVEQVGEGRYSMNARAGEVSLALTLEDSQGPVLQGEEGFSRKGHGQGNASYYISQTRLRTAGTVGVGGETFEVAGESWMDHEFSTSALGEGQVGWDWFALQLSDGSELMLFSLRHADDPQKTVYSGTLIRPDGSTRVLGREDFSLEATDTWRSPHSGAEYPSGWVVRLPEEGVELRIEPKIADQELRLSFVYWEGAVRVSGSRYGQPLSGQGYVELTGYASSMQGQF